MAIDSKPSIITVKNSITVILLLASPGIPVSFFAIKFSLAPFAIKVSFKRFAFYRWASIQMRGDVIPTKHQDCVLHRFFYSSMDSGSCPALLANDPFVIF